MLIWDFLDENLKQGNFKEIDKFIEELELNND